MRTEDTTHETELEKTVGEIVTTDYRAAAVFQKHGIDFCCHGQKLLRQACAENGVDAEALLQEVAEATQSPGDGERYDQWELDFLADYHDETGDFLEKIGELSDGFAPPPGACATYRALYASLQELDESTKKHIHLENNILFPKTIVLEAQLLADG